MLWQINSSYFHAGIVFKENKVIKAAPIVGYMKGWTSEQVTSYCNKKRFTIVNVEDELKKLIDKSF